MMTRVQAAYRDAYDRFGGTVRRTGERLGRDQGFTTLELMAVVLIIGILLSVAIAAYVPASRSAAAAACRSNQRVLEGAFMQAECTVGVDCPEDIEDLDPYVDRLERVKLCPLDGSPLTLDPDTGDISCPNHP